MEVAAALYSHCPSAARLTKPAKGEHGSLGCAFIVA
jgi:hypothetical protein